MKDPFVDLLPQIYLLKQQSSKDTQLQKFLLDLYDTEDESSLLHKVDQSFMLANELMNYS